MKIIFLDIDGVLNFNGCRNRVDGFYFVNDSKIKLLKKIIDKTDAKIVLSSTWRLGWFECEQGIDSLDTSLFIRLKEKLREYGIEFISKTPISNSGYRGEEIDQWLNDWNGEKISSFIIIDDDNDMKPYMDRLVQTSFKYGLRYKNVLKAIRLLNHSNL